MNDVEELNEMFENFYAELGFDEIECEMEATFAYYVGTDCISWSLLSNPIIDSAFSDYLSANHPNCPSISMFIFSFLHELGHYLTLPAISKKKFVYWKKKKRMLEKHAHINCDTDMYNLQLAYCGLPDERIATQKAVELLINNYDYVKQFETDVMKKIFEFYEKNLDI